jgi:hypothetical protein
MPSIDQLLRSFLAARDKDAPDGRPLYAYRCDNVEFEELQTYLAASLPEFEWSARPIGPLTSQVFCLWAAEWWRRNHEGGPWRWEDLLSSVGAGFLGTGNAGYARLCTSVGTGLHGWKRSILRTSNGRAFLVTLACEGGLPLRLVMREHGSLRRYFKVLLEEIRVCGAAGIPVDQIAERTSAYLPKGLRHEVVYSLCGELAAKVWQLQTVVGPTQTSVADLDGLRPGWRDDLPLRVDDAIAAALLNNLLVDASTIARRASGRIRWVRSLVRGGDGWELEGELELPGSLQAREFVAMFSPPAGDAPRRFDLCVRTGNAGTDVVALGTRGHGPSEAPSLRLEPARAAARRVRGEPAAAGRTLVARDGLGQYATDQFAGASPLSELPWVFEAPAQDDAGDRMVGEGSVSVKTPSAFVALPDGAVLSARENGEVMAAGTLREVGRSVFRVAGDAACTLPDGGSVVIRTGDASSGEVEYRLQATELLLGRTAEPVWLGLPRLIERRGEEAPVTIPGHRLQWRPEGSPAGWGPLSHGCIGDGRIRYVDGGHVRFSARAKLLPQGCAVRFTPDSRPDRGTIEISGALGHQVTHVALLGEIPATLRRLPSVGDDLHLELAAAGAPPTSVTLYLEWAQGGRMSLALPFPTCESGFERPQGRRLTAGEIVPLATLSGIRATAMVPRRGAAFTLEGHYMGRDAAELGASRVRLRVPVPEVAPGRFELDLGVVHSWAASRLDASADEDGCVRLEVHSDSVANVATRVLNVARHDITLMLHPDDGAVRLPAESLLRLAPHEVEVFRLEAFPLRRPDEAAVPLKRLSNVTWLLPEVPPGDGPWMIVGWQGEWCRARPCRWDPTSRGFADEGDTGESVGKSGPAVLASSIADLAGSTGDPGWLMVDGLLEWTNHLPPVCFARLRAMARNPAVMALASLRLAEGRFERFWTEMETLPFSWRLVPRTTWEAAVATFVRTTRAEFASLGEAAEFLNPEINLREQLDRGVARVTQRLRCLEPVLGAARARVLGVELTARENAVLRPGLRGFLLQRRHEVLQDSGVTTGDLYGVPQLSDIGALCQRLPTHPEIERLWFRRGLQPTDHRFSIANAPLIAALAALSDVQFNRRQLSELRGIRGRAPDWFDDSYDDCYLFALGVLRQSQLAVHQARDVLPVPH